MIRIQIHTCEIQIILVYYLEPNFDTAQTDYVMYTHLKHSKNELINMLDCLTIYCDP